MALDALGTMALEFDSKLQSHQLRVDNWLHNVMVYDPKFVMLLSYKRSKKSGSTVWN